MAKYHLKSKILLVLPIIHLCWNFLPSSRLVPSQTNFWYPSATPASKFRDSSNSRTIFISFRGTGRDLSYWPLCQRLAVPSKLCSTCRLQQSGSIREEWMITTPCCRVLLFYSGLTPKQSTFRTAAKESSFPSYSLHPLSCRCLCS